MAKTLTPKTVKTLTVDKQLISQSTIGNYTYNGQVYNVYLRQYAWETDLDPVTNTSKIHYNGYLFLDAPSTEYSIHTYDGISSSTSGLINISENLDGYQQIVGTQEKLIIAKSATITHNADGTKSGIIKLDATVNNWFSGFTSVDVICQTIPRYTSVSQSLNSKTETTIKMNWSTTDTIDYVWYSKDNGSTWVAVGSVNAKSGSYNISGLNSSTTYSIKTRVRRNDNQLTSDTSALTVNTYDYPHITTVETSNLIIGNSQKLTIYNPLGRTVTIKMLKDSANGTQLYSGTTTSTSFAFIPNVTTLYNSIPNSKSSNCVYSCTYSSSIRTTQVARTYSINEKNCRPAFNNFAYVDVFDTYNLTKNNQILVNEYSQCKFIISTSNKAVAKNGASISSYLCEWGEKNAWVAYSSSEEKTVVIPNSKGSVLKVTAVDSRGLTTTVTKTVPCIPYTNPVINELETQRENGMNVKTFLRGKFSIWRGNWQNGSNENYSNQLKYVGYRVFDGTTWTSYFDITDEVKTVMTTQNGNSTTMYTFDFNDGIEIHANGSSGGFEVGKEYKVQVLIRDGVTSITFEPTSYQATLQADVTDGKVGFSMNKDSNGDYHIGINCMPDDDYLVALNQLGILKIDNLSKQVSINKNIYVDDADLTLEKIAIQSLKFMEEEVFKNKNYDNLPVGIYKMNTWTGVGGSNYPADNLLGSLIVLKNVQIAISKAGIHTRINDGSWSSWKNIV